MLAGGAFAVSTGCDGGGGGGIGHGPVGSVGTHGGGTGHGPFAGGLPMSGRIHGSILLHGSGTLAAALAFADKASVPG